MPPKRTAAPLCATALVLALAGCGAATTQTSSFKGEQHEVAQAIANLQSDLTASDQKKVCTNDLATAVVARLSYAAGTNTGRDAGCEQALKKQLTVIDTLELAVDSVTLSGAGAQQTAHAEVRSIYEGKTRLSTLSLVKEGGKWKISKAELIPVKAKTTTTTTSSSIVTSSSTTASSSTAGTSTK